MNTTTRARWGTCVFLLLSWSGSVGAGQGTGAAGQAPAPMTAAAQAPAPPASYERVLLTAGRSTVLATDFDITRIAITNPATADAVVVQPREILIDG